LKDEEKFKACGGRKMFFRRKKRLRHEYDAALIQQLEYFKQNWMNQKTLLERSVDPSEEAKATLKIAELKYFYMFREAKQRQAKVKR